MLHLGVADCVGQYPVVRTLTVRSTPPSDTCRRRRSSTSAFSDDCTSVLMAHIDRI